MSVPYTGLFGDTRGLRLSVAVMSWIFVIVVPHSHEVMTTLRSTPCGRAGFSAGTSPVAIRSVQSANIRRARARPRPVMTLFISEARCPMRTRLSHMSTLEL